jgi:hypothetical protein
VLPINIIGKLVLPTNGPDGRDEYHSAGEALIITVEDLSRSNLPTTAQQKYV